MIRYDRESSRGDYSRPTPVSKKIGRTFKPLIPFVHKNTEPISAGSVFF